MPTIRPYQSQVAPEGGLPSRQASGSDFGGAGLQHLGQAVSGAGQDLARGIAIEVHEAKIAQEKIDLQKRQASHIGVQQVISDAQLQAQQQELERRKSMNSGNPDAHVAGAIAFGRDQEESAINAAIENPASPILKEDYAKLRQGMRETSNHIVWSASQFAAGANADYQVQQVEAVADASRNIVQADYTQLPAQLLRGLALTNGLVSIDASKREKIWHGMRQGLYGAAMDGEIDAAAKLHSVEAIQALRNKLTLPGPAGQDGKAPEDNIWQREMAPKAYEGALDRLNVLEQSERAQKDLLAAAGFRERRAEAAAGVQSDFNPVKESAFEPDPIKRELLIKDGHAAVRTGAAVREMARHSHAQQVQALAKGADALATSGNYFEDREVQAAREQAFAQRQHSIGQDMPAELLKNPVVAQAYREMQAGDPAAVDRFARAMEAEKNRIAPGHELQLITKDYMGQIKTTLGELGEGPRGADQALGILSTERTRWGAQWPLVLKQLTQEKILNGPQAEAARMGQDPSYLPDAKLLLTVAAIKPGDFDSLPGIPLGTRSRVTELIKRKLALVQGAFTEQLGGVEALSRAQQATEALTLGYMLQGEKSEEKAATKAAERVITRHANWEPTYLVPLAFNPDLVRAGAKLMQRTVPTASGDASLVVTNTDPSTYGLRTDGTPKGSGFMGVLRRTDNPRDVSTELAMEFESGGKTFLSPAINPLTTRQELDYLLATGKGNAALDKSIADKAFKHGMDRIAAGKSPFAQEGEQQLPPAAVHVVPPKDLRGLQPSDVLAAMEDSLRHKSRWVNTRDGKGLALTWETGEAVLMQQRDGSLVPYELSYDLLSRRGVPSADTTPTQPIRAVPPKAF